MLNFAGDDLGAMLVRLREKRVPVIDREENENGRFASVADPDGTKVELGNPSGSRRCHASLDP